MNRLKKLIVFLMIVLLICACSSNKSSSTSENTTEETNETTTETTNELASPSTSGALHVDGTLLKDENNQTVQLKGASTHGIAWYPQYINKELFKQMHDEWQANVIRLAMYTAESGGYCTDGDQEELKSLLKKGVAYAKEADMYVIIDWHVLNDVTPQLYKDQAKAFFEEISKEFSKENHVIYEICNEPNGSTTWSDVKDYAQEIIPIIRNNDSDALILVGTPTWSQDVLEAANDPLDYDNIMYTLHFYAATHKDDLRTKMQEANTKGLPIFVSEYGICDASGNGTIDEESANAWVEAMDELKISYVCWNLSNKNESSSIFSSDCQKTSDFDNDDLSDEGKWLVNMLGGKIEVSETTEKSTTKTGDLEYEFKCVNSWEADNKTYFQFTGYIKNNSDSPINEWSISLNFNNKIALSDSWNGIYAIDNTKLTIKNADYNGTINANESIDDIGFIVTGDNLQIKAE